MFLKVACLLVVFASVFGDNKANGADSKEASQGKVVGSAHASSSLLKSEVKPADKNDSIATRSANLFITNENNIPGGPQGLNIDRPQGGPPFEPMTNNFLAPSMNNPTHENNLGIIPNIGIQEGGPPLQPAVISYPALALSNPPQENNFGSISSERPFQINNDFGSKNTIQPFVNSNPYSSSLGSSFSTNSNSYLSSGPADRTLNQNEGNCIVEERTLRRGDKWTETGICGLFVCTENKFRVLTTACPTLRYQEGSDCHVTEQDMAVNFPECCPKLECSTKSKTNSQGPSENKEKQQDRNFNSYSFKY